MRVMLVVVVLATTGLAGCVANGVGFDQGAGNEPASTTGQTTAVVSSAAHTAPSEAAALAAASGTYRFTGRTTFEPTIGATQSGALITHNFCGTPCGARLLRSTDQGVSWQDITPRLPTGQKTVPNSNDPYIYVDPFTDMVWDFDMCVTLVGFCASVSTDDGSSWTTRGVVTGWSVDNDHQSLASVPIRGPDPLATEDFTMAFCVNKVLNALGSFCSSSFDGGLTWTPQVPGYPPGRVQCIGVHGHMVGSSDGYLYRGTRGCNGPTVYRSSNGGLSWSQHEVTGGAVNLRSGDHELTMATDASGNVYAFWIATDGLPYLSYSTDHALTWSPPRMVGHPDVTAAGFPAVEAAADGSVAWTYIGTDVDGGYGGSAADMKWSGYLGFTLDALNEGAFANVAVNTIDDPLHDGGACGSQRCGGFGDFVDITIDPEGRPWAALAHNEQGRQGIVGTLVTGPSLWTGAALTPLT